MLYYYLKPTPSTVHGGEHSGSGREVAASDSQHIFTQNVLSVGESCLCTERVSVCVCFTKGWLLDALVACCVSDNLLNI